MNPLASDHYTEAPPRHGVAVQGTEHLRVAHKTAPSSQKANVILKALIMPQPTPYLVFDRFH